MVISPVIKKLSIIAIIDNLTALSFLLLDDDLSLESK